MTRRKKTTYNPRSENPNQYQIFNIEIRHRNNEKNFPAQSSQACTTTRIQIPNEHEGWTPRHKVSSSKRSRSIDTSLKDNSTSRSPKIDSIANSAVDFSFPREIRLLAEPEYNVVFRQGVRVKLDRFIGQVTLNSEGRARLGLAVSKKSCRKASERNRIKRLIREYFRHHKNDLGGRDFIVLITPKAAVTPDHALRIELAKLFEKMCDRTMIKSSKPSTEAHSQ